MSRLKLYIAIRDDVPTNMVPVICAHAAMAAMEEFHDDKLFQEWRELSFKKVIVSVNQKNFENLKQIPRAFTMSEKKTINNESCCVVVPVMSEYPNVVKFSTLWKVN